MHGVSEPFVSRAFKLFGLVPPTHVPEQQVPDPDFPTVTFPNPEEKGKHRVRSRGDTHVSYRSIGDLVHCRPVLCSDAFQDLAMKTAVKNNINHVLAQDPVSSLPSFPILKTSTENLPGFRSLRCS